MTAAAMVAEFDDVAGWTADAIAQLGARYAVPAACRGTSNPAALAWLAEACELRRGDRLLDVGAGAGGPAVWAANRFGVRPVLVDPMLNACRAAARLFELPVLAGDGGRIPLRAGCVDAAWCLGVLCTVADKGAVLREIHRVLSPGAPLGLAVVVSTRQGGGPGPDGNHFPRQERLAAVLTDAGFRILEQVPFPADAPLSWSRRVDEVTTLVAAQHSSDPAFALAERQGRRLTRMFADKQISMQLIHAVSDTNPSAFPTTGDRRCHLTRAAS